MWSLSDKVFCFSRGKSVSNYCKVHTLGSGAKNLKKNVCVCFPYSVNRQGCKRLGQVVSLHWPTYTIFSHRFHHHLLVALMIFIPWAFTQYLEVAKVVLCGGAVTLIFYWTGWDRVPFPWIPSKHAPYLQLPCQLVWAIPLIVYCLICHFPCAAQLGKLWWLWSRCWRQPRLICWCFHRNLSNVRWDLNHLGVWIHTQKWSS